jgi:2,4-dienoyl-CoA reductase-like NADH-dependent reductase (Old Yellow Enzyme family)/thioredoxin reductase
VAARDLLLQPFRLKHLELRNRILSTAHAPAYGERGMPGERYQRYHEEKARGGLALTMFGGSASVAIDSPASLWNQIDVSTDAVIRRFREFADRIHAHGAALMCQLTHMGRRTRWDAGDWITPVSSSAVREPAHNAVPKAAEDHDIERIQQSYARAAVRCREGGLDGCEILFASHLVWQFLTPRVNRRDDAYGGSLENRLRFGLEILEQVRAAVGDDFIVGVRMTGDEMVAGGLSHEACVEVFRRIGETGLVDFLSVIGGEVFTHRELADYMPNMAWPEAPYRQLARAVRETTGLPVFHASRIATLDDAARVLADGCADMVGMTRAQIADPHLVRKLEEGRLEEIRPCVGANYCIDRLYAGKDAVCLHNAATGRELRLPHEPARAERPRRIVIAGAGPAGLEAGRVCAERGHQVVVFEREDRAGGQLRLAARAPWRSDLGAITSWLEARVRKLGGELRLGWEATPERVLDELPDVVIVATGGRPQRGAIPGDARARTTWDVLSGAQALAGRVLVYDEHGEHQALSCAELLAKQGAEVELVTPARLVGEELGAINFAVHLRELYGAGVRITPDHRLARIEADDDTVRAVLCNEYTRTELRRSVDHVVVEQGTLPVADLYFALKPSSSNRGEIDWRALIEGRGQEIRTNPEGSFQLFRIGDAVASRNVHAAIHDALRLCSLL